MIFDFQSAYFEKEIAMHNFYVTKTTKHLASPMSLAQAD